MIGNSPVLPSWPLAIVLIITATGSAFAAPCVSPLFGAAHPGGPSAPSTLYAIDPNTGTATAVGPIGFNRVGGIDFHPTTGVLYAVGERAPDSVTVLITIDPDSGAGTEVGPLVNSDSGDAHFDLSFRNADGALFLLAFSPVSPCTSLFTVDPSTGTATEIGDTTTCASGDALGFSLGDTLYQSNNESGVTLFEVDPILAVSQPVATLSYIGFPTLDDPRPNAMDFDPASALAFVSVNDGRGGSGPNYLGQLNLSTGEIRHIGVSVNGLDAVAVRLAERGPFIGALPNKTEFFWTDWLSYLYVGGEFTVAGDIGTYMFGLSGSGSGKLFQDPVLPPEQDGLWYLLRPDCDAGSWSSGGLGECAPAGACPPGGRDGSLP
jgi:hypothetical protein